MKSSIRNLSILLAFVIVLTACTPAAVPTQKAEPTFDVNPIYTAAAATIAVESTRNAALIPTATATVEPTEAPTATPTETLAPTMPVGTAVTSLGPTPTLWIPVSGDSRPSITAIYDTNCRQGPDENFEIVGAIRVGDTSEVYGMLPYGAWWYIKNPGKDTPKYCWVWGETTKVEGSTDSVQEISAPPTPYISKPKVTLSAAASPSTSATCPVRITFTGTIKTSAEGDFSYQFYNDEGKIYKQGVMSFKDDGTNSFTFTRTFDEDYTGWVQLKVTNPVAVKSGKASINIDCP